MMKKGLSVPYKNNPLELAGKWIVTKVDKQDYLSELMKG